MKLHLTLFTISLTLLVAAACGTPPPPAEPPAPDFIFVTVTPAPPTVESLAAQPQPTPAAGTTASAAPFHFTDVTAAAGISFRHGVFQQSITKDPAAMMGGGLCWLDFDGDGWLDLYAVNSYSLHEEEMLQSQGALPRNALYRNLGNGTFADVSAGSGADISLRGNGCISGDINQDGLPDIYVTADGPNALLLNQGNGTFVESAAQAGLDTPGWSTAAALGDVDGDGRVDLYVAGFIDLEITVPDPIGIFPQDFLGQPDHLYRNRGDGTFEDVVAQAGLRPDERGLGAVFSDFDRDGDLDLYVANDGQPNRLYLNQGDGTFTEDSVGMGVDDRGSGMGVSAGDYSGDGWPDLVVMNFEKEYSALYRHRALQDGGLKFDNATFKIGIQGFGQNQTSWGVTWQDFDRDGHLDLATAQGKVPVTGEESDQQLLRIYRNRGDGAFRDFSRLAGMAEVGPQIARGLAAADYDNDGDVDLAVGTIGGGILLLQNNAAPNHWLTVSLARPVPGTQIFATLPDGSQQFREIHAGSSYLSSEDPRPHFGLGQNRTVENLRIVFPGGRTLEYNNVPADQILPINAAPGAF